MPTDEEGKTLQQPLHRLALRASVPGVQVRQWIEHVASDASHWNKPPRPGAYAPTEKICQRTN